MNAVDMLFFESDCWGRGLNLIAGVDEVGRGSLAGPMVVCAVILNKNLLPKQSTLPNGATLYSQVRDSKQVTPKRRSILSKFLLNEVLCYSIVEVPHYDIDNLGISACTKNAFLTAVKQLGTPPDHVLTDNFNIPLLAQESQTNLVRGDNRSLTIAAASIIAKVYRDELMVSLHNKHRKYQMYGFDRHKGYGTRYHRQMIKKHGLSDIHRKSFHISFETDM